MRVFLLIAGLLLLPVAANAGSVSPVAVSGYSGEAMEPFVSRDGRFLFFNTRNDPGVNTNILFAERGGEGWRYQGELSGTVSAELDGTPTMSADGRFCFVSTRSYFKTLVTVYCGMFDGRQVSRVTPQSGLAGAKVGLLTFDVDVSADGCAMIFAEGTFSGGAVPDVADLHLATWTGQGYVRDAGGDRVLARINTPDLEYAPALSADGLTLYFTRMSGFWIFRSAQIYVARRAAVDQPFGAPELFTPADGFVEAATLMPDGAVVFHKRVNDRFGLWMWRR
jgi:hypothetical protein